MSKTLEKRFNERANSTLSLSKNRKSGNEFRIEVKGDGIHWYCLMKQSESNERQVEIHFTEIDRKDITNPAYKGVMYDIAYYEKEEHYITGRAFREENVLASVEDWFQGIQKEVLYAKYEFIDNTRKRLTAILQNINQNYPSIKQLAEENSVKAVSLSERIIITKGNRSCEGYFYAYEAYPRFIFKWDEATIFEHSTADYKRVGELINDWIINFSMPSVLASKFKEVRFGKLGSYYEKGRGIEGEFILSWEAIERFYGELSDEWHPFKKDAIRLIKEMRSHGLDKELRAGQSLFFLVLSRARRHGLETRHAYVHLTFLGEDKMKIKSSYDDAKKEETFEVKYEGYIREVVEKLLKEDIE
ncbi:MAG: hypothetical protein ACFB0B_06025 [Thermonemataceae bacterium]